MINRIAQHFPTSYIFRTDFFALLHNCPNEQLYNEATGEVSPTPIRRVARFKKDGSYDDSVTGTDCIFRKREADAEIGPRGLTVRDHKLRVLGCIERDIAI